MWQCTSDGTVDGIKGRVDLNFWYGPVRDRSYNARSVILPVKPPKLTSPKPPVRASIKSVKAGKKKLTVTWKKDKAVSGYQIKVATKKNFKGAKTYTVKSYKTYKKVIKKLKAKKKYFVKVRAYKTVGKSKVYGAYSAVRSCKVK